MSFAQRFPPVLLNWRGEALRLWNDSAQEELDELLAVHTRVAGTGGNKRGRRYYTQQLNGLLLVALAAKFQAFCRDLHTEAVSYLVADIPLKLQLRVFAWLTRNRKLDWGSAEPKSIGADFSPLVPDFWKVVEGRQKKAGDFENLMERYKSLHQHRHGVAHEDLSKFSGGKRPVLNDFKAARKCCLRLAPLLNEAVMQGLSSTVPNGPVKLAVAP